jgi:hypothetical protein
MRAIVSWFERLPIQSTTAVVAVLSGLVTTAVWAISRRSHHRWPAALAGPFIIAAALYSIPASLADPAGRAEYGSWAGLFIAIWGVAGVGVSLLVAFVWMLTTRRRWKGSRGTV